MRDRFGPIGPLELVLVGIIALLVLFSAAVLVVPGLAPVAVDRSLDLVMNTTASLAAGGVAALAWGRYREGRQVAALYQASAFLLLCSMNVLMLVVQLVRVEHVFGLALDAPGQLPIYLTVTARLLAAVLLAVGAVAGSRGWSPERQPGAAVLLAPTVVLGALGAFLALQQGALPILLADAALEAMRQDPTDALAGGQIGPLAFLQVMVGTVYLGAAALYLRLHSRVGQARDAFLTAGLIVAAFAQLHFALHPGAYAGLVTTGDVLRVAFYGILLLGVDTERRHDLRALRLAHEDLKQLHDTELARAALAERSRLAREIHDGLAQDLWYAKLKQGRLAKAGELGAEARQLVGEVATAIDSALTEARQAVMALRPQQSEGDSFLEVLKRYVDDFGDRFGLRAELEGSPDMPQLAPRVQAELLRIVQEAMNNTRRHADATMVRLRAACDDERMRIEVSDNGRGFEPATLEGGGYGLHSMRERATLIGGTLTVSSAPQDGTRVTVELPLSGLPAVSPQTDA